MEPLLVFIAKVRTWHVLTVAAFALIFAIVGYLTDNEAVSRAQGLQRSILSVVAIPVMLFTLAFLAYVSVTKDFGALALFPSIFIVLTAFAVVAIIGSGIEDPDFPYLIFGIMGLVASVVMSGLICAMIAIRLKIGW